MSCRTLAAILAVTTCVASTSSSVVHAAPLFDELRFGAVGSIEKNGNREEGAFVSGIVFFDPFGHDEASGWEKLARPRVHVGGDISTAGEANQLYAGFSWTYDITDWLFLEGGFGGTIHDGKLDEDPNPGPKLGSAVLFHEYAAVGFKLDANWRLVANIEHSSHAGLADGPNSGLSRAGVMSGYKF